MELVQDQEPPTLLKMVVLLVTLLTPPNPESVMPVVALWIVCGPPGLPIPLVQ